jgi:hypothetical protein
MIWLNCLVMSKFNRTLRKYRNHEPLETRVMNGTDVQLLAHFQLLNLLFRFLCSHKSRSFFDWGFARKSWKNARLSVDTPGVWYFLEMCCDTAFDLIRSRQIVSERIIVIRELNRQNRFRREWIDDRISRLQIRSFEKMDQDQYWVKSTMTLAEYLTVSLNPELHGNVREL